MYTYACTGHRNNTMSHSAPRRCSCPYLCIQWRRHCSYLIHSALTLTVCYLNPDLRVYAMYSIWIFRWWLNSVRTILLPFNDICFHGILTVIRALNLIDNPSAIQWFIANTCERIFSCHQRYLNGALTGVQANYIQLLTFDSVSPLDPGLTYLVKTIGSNMDSCSFSVLIRLICLNPILAVMRAVNPMDWPVFCFMTIVVANYRYVNWIHEARFTWKRRILQDALWDDGIRFSRHC